MTNPEKSQARNIPVQPDLTPAAVIPVNVAAGLGGPADDALERACALVLADPDDARAWVELHQLAAVVIRRAVRRAGVLAEHDAQDVGQDVLLRVVRSLDAAPVGNIARWVCRVSRNAATDFLRRNSRYKETPLDPASFRLQADALVPDPRRRQQLSDLLSAVRRCFDRLPNGLKMVVSHCWIGGHTASDADAVFGLPRGTAARRLRAVRRWAMRRLVRAMSK